MPLQTYETGFQALGKTKLTILLIWGKQDITFPYSNAKKAQQYLPQAKLITIENSRHVPQYEQPVLVNSHMSSFIDVLIP